MSGNGFTIEWTGPLGNGDLITIANKDMADDAYLTYFELNAEQTKGELSVPSDPGVYELRYMTRPGKVLVRQPLEIKKE